MQPSRKTWRRHFSLAFLVLAGITGCTDSVQKALTNELTLETETIDQLMTVVDEPSATAYMKGFRKFLTEEKRLLVERKDKLIQNESQRAKVFLCPGGCGTIHRNIPIAINGFGQCPICNKPVLPPYQNVLWRQFFKETAEQVALQMQSQEPPDYTEMFLYMEDRPFCLRYVREKVDIARGREREKQRIEHVIGVLAERDVECPNLIEIAKDLRN